MNYKLANHDILYNDDQLGPYPEQLLKRVDKLTTTFVGVPKRKAHNDTAGHRVMQGSLGAEIAKKLSEKNAQATDEEMHGKPKPPTKKNEPLAAAFTEVRAHARTIKEIPNEVAPEKAPIPMDPRVLSRHFKSLAYFMGADAVGICEVPEYGYYLDDPDGNPINCDYKYAIVIAKRKDPKTTVASTGRDRVFDACSHQCYQVLGQWTETIANYIRRLGYEALASNSRNYITVMPTLILAAGLGENSRLGIPLNPFFGANFKACCTLTNIPLEPDKPIDFGLQDYCEKCDICSKACGAISASNEKEEYNGYLKWKIDYERCAANGVSNPFGSSCGRCTTICPWNRPNSLPEDFKAWDGSIEWLHKAADERAEYIRAHKYLSEEHETKQWWFDLVMEDGKYVIPRTAKFEIAPYDEEN